MSSEITGGTYALCTTVAYDSEGTCIVSNPVPISSSFNLELEATKLNVDNFPIIPSAIRNAIGVYIARLNGENVHPARGQWGLAKCWGPISSRYMIVVECLVTSRAVARVSRPALFLPKPSKIVTFMLGSSATISALSEIPVIQGFKNQEGENVIFTKLMYTAQSAISKVIREVNGNERDWTKQPWGLTSISRSQGNVYFLLLEWQHAGFSSPSDDAQSNSERPLPPPYAESTLHVPEPTQ